MPRATRYCKELNTFAGAAHIMYDDEEQSISSDEPPLKTRNPLPSVNEQSSGKTRECTSYDKTREQSTSNPYADKVFAHIKTTPLSSQFCLPTTPQVIK